MNEDGILTALKYSVNASTIAQLRAILSKCDFDENELHRIVTLNDKLAIYGAYIAMSNSNDCFKIKNEAKSDDAKNAVRELILSWSDKYKLKLEKIDTKETYYIVGRF